MNLDEKRLLDYFLKLVRIRSFGGEEASLAEAVLEELKKYGIECKTDKMGNLHSIIPSNLDAAYKADPVMLCCHLDTVRLGDVITPVVDGGIIRSDGSSILGADDKAGIAAIIEMVKALHEQSLPHGDIELVLTVGEETGLTGSAGLEYSKLKSQICYVIDGSMKPGNLTTKAPFKHSVRAEVRGRPAHAGTNPESGISAIQAAAFAISRMKLLRIDAETTANIGSFSAAGSENVVCPRASFSAEVRSQDIRKLERELLHMKECLDMAAAAFGAAYTFEVVSRYEGYSIPVNDRVVEYFKKACKGCGLEFGTNVSGGGTDANNFNQHGIRSVVVGTGVNKPHTAEESISIEDLKNTARLLIELVTVIAGKGS